MKKSPQLEKTDHQQTKKGSKYKDRNVTYHIEDPMPQKGILNSAQSSSLRLCHLMILYHIKRKPQPVCIGIAVNGNRL